MKAEARNHESMIGCRTDQTTYKLRPCPRQDYSERRHWELQLGHEFATEDQDALQLTTGPETIMEEMRQIAEVIARFTQSQKVQEQQQQCEKKERCRQELLSELSQ